MSFFKYMSASTARIVLQTQRLRWSTAKLLNDPYDLQFWVHRPVDIIDVRRLSIEKFNEVLSGVRSFTPGNPIAQEILRRLSYRSLESFRDIFPSFVESPLKKINGRLNQHNEELKVFFSTTKFFCLSLDALNIQMWSHYADSHRGVVLEFDTPEGIDSPWKVAKPVRYLQDLPNIFDSDFWSDYFSGSRNFDHAHVMNTILYSKHVGWGYEKEWRICSGDGRFPNESFEDVPFNPRELKAVILGCKMESSQREWFASLLEMYYPHVTLYEAILSNSSYSLSRQNLYRG